MDRKFSDEVIGLGAVYVRVPSSDELVEKLKGDKEFIDAVKGERGELEKDCDPTVVNELAEKVKKLEELVYVLKNQSDELDRMLREYNFNIEFNEENKIGQHVIYGKVSSYVYYNIPQNGINQKDVDYDIVISGEPYDLGYTAITNKNSHGFKIVTDTSKMSEPKNLRVEIIQKNSGNSLKTSRYIIPKTPPKKPEYVFDVKQLEPNKFKIVSAMFQDGKVVERVDKGFKFIELNYDELSSYDNDYPWSNFKVEKVEDGFIITVVRVKDTGGIPIKYNFFLIDSGRKIGEGVLD